MPVVGDPSAISNKEADMRDSALTNLLLLAIAVMLFVAIISDTVHF
jgi:inorganic pyrophosphatase/exopolyphosphatase